MGLSTGPAAGGDLRYTRALYRLTKDKPVTSPAIQFEGVQFHYPGGPPVLYGIDLVIEPGESVALIGINGSGKSTLLRMLIGLLHPLKGQVTIGGVNTRTASIGALARQVGFAFQQPEHQLFAATVREEVAFGPRNLGLRGDTLRTRVAETLDQFALTDLADHPPAVLSFSVRRLVALAGIAAMRAPILALDEPLVGLDGLWRRRVIAWLDAHRASGGTTLMITHHLRLAAKTARVLVMQDGQITADGPPGVVFAQPDVLRAAGLAEPFSVALGRALDLPGPALRIRDLHAALSAARAEEGE